MKLLKLLFLSAILLSACNNDSTDTPETGEPKQIIVEMASPMILQMSPAHILLRTIKNTVLGKTENIRYYWSRVHI